MGAFVGEGIVTGTGGGAGVLVDPCGGASRLKAYRLTLAAAFVDAPTCWGDGGVPQDAGVLTEQTFEVLVATKDEQATLGVSGLGAQPLGHVAVVRVGEGVGGTGTRFPWTEITSLRGPALDDAIEVRTVEAIFEFDRFDTAQTAGTLTLTSRWQCMLGPPPRNASCGAPPPDVSGCSVVKTFTAEAIPLPDHWTTPAEPLDGGRTFLVSLDLGAMSRLETRCGIAGQPLPTSTLTPNLRALEVWQMTPELVRAVPRSYQLGDAPLIEVGSDFGQPPANTQTRTVETSPASDLKETRTTSATLAPRVCGFFVDDAGVSGDAVLALSSSFDCTGTGCPLDSLGNPARSFCQLDLPWFAIEFGPFVTAP
ncbi:MAG: hypothetical protein Q8L48_37660 [Archangium sp.]|nr:hypothetical protein [Archangium sp.]